MRGKEFWAFQSMFYKYSLHFWRVNAIHVRHFTLFHAARCVDQGSYTWFHCPLWMSSISYLRYHPRYLEDFCSGRLCSTAMEGSLALKDSMLTVKDILHSEASSVLTNSWGVPDTNTASGAQMC